MTLDKFIVKTTEDTIFKLIDEIKIAIFRLRFLMDRAILSCMSNVLLYIQLQTFKYQMSTKDVFAFRLSSFPQVDDVKLNACVFAWPKKILRKLDDNKVRLVNTREQTEEHIKQR